ncbi:MAG: MFS transporter [Betaproteobacteria bacterium]|nr:MFS transporter [Betaproteobacteria bacterium]
MQRQILIPLIVACALFMENMDSTVLATSLPAIAADIGENPLALKLALTSYLVSLAVFIPISGWVADRFGSRTIFATAIVVFMCGSLLCAVSGTLTAFVLARFVQGIGGAMMVPVGRLVLLKTVPKSGLVEALNYLTVPALLGPIIGPVLGGLITEYFNWRGIFLINVPISILGLVLVLRHIPNIRESELPSLDLRGFMLLGIGLSLLVLGLSALGGHLLRGAATAACIAIGALALAGYAWHARSVRDPVLDLELLKYSTFRAGILGGSLFRIGVGATPFLLPLLFQLGFGLDPFHSGLLSCTTAVGAMFVKTATVMILKRYGFRRVLVANAVLAAAGTGVYGLFTAGTPQAIIIAVLLLSGCLRSLQFTAIAAVTFAEITRATMSQAASVQSMAARLSQSIGVAVAAYVLQISSDLQGHAAVVTADFWPTFIVIALISAASIFSNLAIAPDAGAEISGHGKKKTP